MSDRQRMIPNFKVDVFVQILSEVADYNHRLMNVPEMWKHTRGKGIKVAVLDTGKPVHNDIKLAGSASMVPGYLEDKNGHSTHCCGIIAAVADNGMGVKGIAPDVDLYACAVLDGNGSGTADWIAAGIRWAVDVVGADVISMSLGMPPFPISSTLKSACTYAARKGAIICAAAGNEAGPVGQPALYDSTICVAAVDDAGKHAPFSGFGKQVDFATGGVNVYSTFLNNGYAKLSGTSMATPALAGAVALILADARSGATPRRLSLDEVKAKLRKIVYDVGPTGWDPQFGWGIPVFGKSENSVVEPAPATNPSLWSRIYRTVAGWFGK